VQMGDRLFEVAQACGFRRSRPCIPK
jgi:hypothetical protein